MRSLPCHAAEKGGRKSEEGEEEYELYASHSGVHSGNLTGAKLRYYLSAVKF